ncbi:MAG TPA: 50S ribosomal protein L23 [Candidatus Thermoplasmatota archaeon]|nr:50S ribosomal protein L23 [Candidatus Thermoplasmatota archaeon]
MKSAYEVIDHPFVTEKTMAQMEKDNKLEFVVRRDASKAAIKKAIEELFQARVIQVNTKITTDGRKHAVVRFAPDVKAEEIGTRIGIF